MARILVIDDEATIRMMLRMALQKTGHAVGQAADGLEGLEAFGQGDGWDVVLLDQRMPGMEGLDVLREMRRRDPTARVIIITAFGTIDLVVEAMKAGAKDFLRKPFTLETLYGAIQAALSDVTSGAPLESPVSPFSVTTLNGFRIDALRVPTERKAGAVQQALSVRGPNGTVAACEVSLSPEVVSLVKLDAGSVSAAPDDGFWQALCEEALANYLWQNPQVPPDGALKVEEYTTSLRRWVLATLAPGQEAVRVPSLPDR